MSKLPAISSYDAAFLKEASNSSSAVSAYLRQTPAASPEDLLRYERNQLWLQAALATLSGAPAADVCHFWSERAEEILSRVFAECFADKEIALFALGKLGSSELNLSSDVDLMLICRKADPSFVADLRKFQKMLADRTPTGFVFRVDFDLRAGGRNGPLISSLDHFVDYYGNYGETWERMAFVRLRGLAGDIVLREEVLTFARKFTYRRHLDFTLMEDLKTLRRKIHAHYWDRASEGEVDLKLGLGGIRDVELFVHALQVIHGGRDPRLQAVSTGGALDELQRKKILDENDAGFLKAHYWNLRTLENLVQASGDEQTHILKKDFLSASPLRAGLEQDLQKCDEVVGSLLGDAPPDQQESAIEDLIPASDAEIRGLWEEVLRQEVQSHSKERDEAARLAFLQEFVRALRLQGGNLKQGLSFLLEFVAGTKAKATFFSLLLREKTLLDGLAWLFGYSPYLAKILCSRPELLDSFVYQSQDRFPEEWDQLLETLSEKKLLSELINGGDYLKNKNIERLNARLTSTADSIVTALLEKLRAEFPSTMKILALGKWGGQELGFRSDLDFIFVTAEAPEESDFKLARRFISRLTDPHRGGRLYAIDMRLRPSGKAGPMIATESELENYLRHEALAWERQAYLKARWIGGEGFDPREVCISKNLAVTDLRELERIRKELLPKTGHLNLKYSAGGLIDIEFTSQICLLTRQINPGGSRTIDFMDALGTSAEALKPHYLRLRQIEQMLQLVASQTSAELPENHELFQSLAVALQILPENLKDEIDLRLSQTLQILNQLDPRRQSH